MSSFDQITIGGYPGGGLTTDKKPLMLADQAFSELRNAYVFRDRTRKREGTVGIGRLQRNIPEVSFFPTTSSPFKINILTVTGYISDADNSNPGQITTFYAHNLSTGDKVIISDVVGATGYNNTTFTITVVDATNFTIGADATGFGVYVSGGIFVSNRRLESARGSISAANNANPGQVTTVNPHNLINGDKVIISNMVGATGYNGPTFTITVVNSTNFTIGVSAAGFGAYVSGGNFVSIDDSEPNASIKPGSVVYTILTGTTRIFTDNGLGNLISNVSPGSNFGTINYETGIISITTNAGSPRDTLLEYSYYPGLPVMGICKQDILTNGIDNTIFFDTKYSYQFLANAFQELVSTTPTVWTGDFKQFFWYCNYQGTNTSIRYFFTTNNNISDPIRYYNNSTWTDLTPIIADNPPSAAQSKLFQALIVIPYYGRLLALNTWEGLTSGGTGSASNFFARCRFSQVGDPTASDAWRSDLFGKGGFLDAPTNESIVSAAFFRNTLIVFFEYSTWQLRYIGEYGLPFIFERISSDYGAVSTFSPIIFDQGVMAVSDRGIIQANAGQVARLDEQIPQTAFSFEIQNSGPNFVHGIRDFEKEVVFWNYLDKTTSEDTQIFPNTTLLFNYRNNSWAKFRDTITCFGTTQFQFGITWDSTTTFWSDESIYWDSSDDQDFTTYIAAGNQLGYVFVYEDQEAETPIASVTLYAASLFIADINNSVSPATLTIPTHNLQNGEIIYLTGALWSGSDPGINSKIYNVTVIDEDTISLGLWDQVSLSYSAVTINSSPIYIGGGEVALLLDINIVGKDFNPYQAKGKQFKLSFIDFQMDSDESIPSIPAVTVQLFVNSYLGEQANVGGHQELLVNSSLVSNFINDATKANPCEITCKNHSLTSGNLIYIANVQGMTQLNSGNYIITVVDADHFTLNVDSTGFSTYVTGGIFNVLPSLGTTYQTGSQYAWFRFYSTQFGQYLRVALTYDDTLMNQLATHQSSMELNAMTLWMKEGGRLIN